MFGGRVQGPIHIIETTRVGSSLSYKYDNTRVKVTYSDKCTSLVLVHLVKSLIVQALRVINLFKYETNVLRGQCYKLFTTVAYGRSKVS